jgi:hypothetical protein
MPLTALTSTRSRIPAVKKIQTFQRSFEPRFIFGRFGSSMQLILLIYLHLLAPMEERQVHSAHLSGSAIIELRAPLEKCAFTAKAAQISCAKKHHKRKALFSFLFVLQREMKRTASSFNISYYSDGRIFYEPFSVAHGRAPPDLYPAS